MNNKIFYGIGIFWLLIFIGFIAMKEYTFQTGEEVLLRTAPVDPRDIFRGDYVILRYEISTIETDRLFESGETVYVMLVPDGKFHKELGIFRSPPDGLFIKGRVIDNTAGRISITYGIESYFVPQGEGRIIERSQDVIVKALIDKDGGSLIKGLIVDGVELEYNSGLKG